MHKAIVVAALIVLVAAPARAQYVDPQVMMNRLLLDQWRKHEERRQEDIQRRNLERYYAKLPPGDLIGELHRYCPTGEPPCAYAPPDALVQEAARRGLIIFNNDVPSRNPIGTTPGLTSRTAPQVDFGKDDPVAHLPRDGRMSGLPGGLKCADLLNNGREVCFFTITIGKIGIDTVEGVKKLLDYKHRSSRLIGGSVVFLNSPGGDVYPAMEIGRILRKERLPIWIEKDAKCISACVLILAAAERRTIDGTVGIHRPYFATPRRAQTVTPDAIKENYESMLHDMRDYLREMNLPDLLADEMLRIEPDRVRKLARAELNAYGLGEGAPTEDTQKKAVAREILAVKGAEAYGLSRIEYMRRDALTDRTCKLDINTRPGDAFDFDELGNDPGFDTWAPEKKLEHYIQTEETGWSRCYKRIMSNGK